MSLLSFVFLFWQAGATPTTVDNPVAPGPYTLTFEEDLRFGAEEDGDHFIWPNGVLPSNFSIDSRGHFFIMATRDSKVYEFDPDGKYIGVIVIKGQGPGEFTNLHYFRVLADGRAVGFDFLQGVGKFNWYDTNLKYKDTKTQTGFETIFFLPEFSPSGKLFYAWYFNFDTANNQTLFKTGVFDADLKLQKELSADVWPTPTQALANDSGALADFIGEQFKSLLNRGATFARFLDDGSVAIADSRKYTIEKWGDDFKTKRMIINKKFEAVAMNDENRTALIDRMKEAVFAGAPQLRSVLNEALIQRAIDKAEIPARQNPISNIFGMEDGGFLVVQEVHYTNNSFTADIFDKAGKCVGRTTFPGSGVLSFFGSRVSFQKGYAYAMETTEDEENQMVRYKYKLVKK